MAATKDEEASRGLVVGEPILTREVGWPTIVAFLIAVSAILLLIPFLRTIPAGAILGGAAWWENLNLFVILLLVTVGGIALAMGRLRPSDLGVKLGKLFEGFVVTALAWTLMQIWPLVASGSAEVARTWSDPGVLSTLRWAVVMFVATALWEEIAFRGFLLPQMYLKLPGGPWVRIWGAILISQILFAAAHAPAHVILRALTGGPLLQMLFLQGFAGVLLGLLYLRTRNLWIAVGIHGLANAPTPITGGALSWEIPLVVILIAWPWIKRRPTAKGFARIIRSGRAPRNGEISARCDTSAESKAH